MLGSTIGVGAPGGVFGFWERPARDARRARLCRTNVAVSGVTAAVSVISVAVVAIPVNPQTIAVTVAIPVIPVTIAIAVVGAGSGQPVIGLGLKRVPGRARRSRRYSRIAVVGG